MIISFVKYSITKCGCKSCINRCQFWYVCLYTM